MKPILAYQIQIFNISIMATRQDGEPLAYLFDPRYTREREGGASIFLPDHLKMCEAMEIYDIYGMRHLIRPRDVSRITEILELEHHQKTDTWLIIDSANGDIIKPYGQNGA